MPGAPFFRRRLSGLGIPAGPRTVLALGISGGPDSTALLGLACDWARGCGARIVALCFDHRLRADSTNEAIAVTTLARDLGATAEILAWEGERPDTGVQEKARTRRLEALFDACRRHGAACLLLAHHAGDQAETVRMRATRSSSVHSLSGMAMMAFHRDVALVRPLLDVPKADLVAFCRNRGLPFFEDPSNTSPVFERVRIREDLTGTDTGPLLAAAAEAAAGRAREAREVADCLARSVLGLGEGALCLDRTDLASAPPDTTRAALRHMARSLSGSAFFPRIKPLCDTLAADGTGRLTWGGCLWTRHRSSANPMTHAAPVAALSVARAAPAALVRQAVPLPPGRPVLWDGRFEITADRPGLAVHAAGKHAFAPAREAPEPTAPQTPGARAAVPAPAGGTKSRGRAGALPGPVPPDPRTADAASPRIVALCDPDPASGQASGPACSGDSPSGLAPVPGESGSVPKTAPFPVVVRYRPRFPVLEEGLRLEAAGQEPYIQS